MLTWLNGDLPIDEEEAHASVSNVSIAVSEGLRLITTAGYEDDAIQLALRLWRERSLPGAVSAVVIALHEAGKPLEGDDLVTSVIGTSLEEHENALFDAAAGVAVAAPERWARLASNLVLGGHPELALKIADTLLAGNWRASALREIAVGLARVGELDSALQRVAEADEGDRALILVAIAESHVAIGNLKAAEDIAKARLSGVHRSEVGGHVALALARAGRVEEAARVIDRLLNEPRAALDDESLAYAFGGLALAHSKLGDREAASRTLAWGREVLANVSDPGSRALALCMLARISRWIGVIEQQDRLAQDLVREAALLLSLASEPPPRMASTLERHVRALQAQLTNSDDPVMTSFFRERTPLEEIVSVVVDMGWLDLLSPMVESAST